MIVAASWWYTTLAPHDSPTDHISFLWGVLHGVFLWPNLLYSLFNDSVTIYQSPNSGVVYDFGYVLGLIAAYAGFNSAAVRR